MKRILFFLLLCVIARVNCFSWEIYHDLELDGVYYEVRSEDEQTMSVVGFSKICPSECVIPEYVKYNNIYYRVTALEGCRIIDGGELLFGRYKYIDGETCPSILHLPGSISFVGSGIFEDSFIKEIFFEDGDLTSLNSNAVSDCRIEKVVLPNSLKTIGNYCLSYNPFLDNVNIPSDIEWIGDYAFTGANNRDEPWYWQGARPQIPLNIEKKQLILPNSLKHLGKKAFYDSYWDNVLVLSNNLDTIPENAFSFTSLPNLIIPNNVKKIDKGAFNNEAIVDGHHGGDDYIKHFTPTDLKQLTLGTSIEDIAEGAFGYAPELKYLYCLPSTPPKFVFDDFNSEATVLVPPGKLDLYKEAQGWDHFNSFKELPNILIQFQINKYFIPLGENTELKYVVSNLGNVEIVSSEWSCDDPDALDIEDDIVTGYQKGDYYLTLTITDSLGLTYSEKCLICIDTDGSGIDNIYNSQHSKQDNTIIGLNGIKHLRDDNNLLPGIYISKGKKFKISN